MLLCAWPGFPDRDPLSADVPLLCIFAFLRGILSVHCPVSQAIAAIFGKGCNCLSRKELINQNCPLGQPPSANCQQAWRSARNRCPACGWGELDDEANAIKNLRLAYQYKKNMIPGERLPDPMTDSSFSKFLDSNTFKKAVKEMKSGK